MELAAHAGVERGKQTPVFNFKSILMHPVHVRHSVIQRKIRPTPQLSRSGHHSRGCQAVHLSGTRDKRLLNEARLPNAYLAGNARR